MCPKVRMQQSNNERRNKSKVYLWSGKTCCGDCVICLPETRAFCLIDWRESMTTCLSKALTRKESRNANNRQGNLPFLHQRINLSASTEEGLQQDNWEIREETATYSPTVRVIFVLYTNWYLNPCSEHLQIISQSFWFVNPNIHPNPTS